MSGDRVLSKRKAYLKRQQEIHDSFIRKETLGSPYRNVSVGLGSKIPL